MILRDIPTKSLFLVFNFSVSENTVFMILMFQELQVSKLRKERNPVSFSSGERPWAQDTEEEGQEAQKGVSHAARFPGRVWGPQMGPQHFLPEVFLWTTPSSPKSNTLIFPRRDGAARAAKLLKLSAGETDPDRKSTRLNSSHSGESRMPSSA